MATIPLATGVGWVVSPVIKLMFEKVQSYISTQYKWRSNLDDDLKKLETILTEILLVVGTAERRRTLDCTQQALLHQLKDAVYDAEDILDEFDYMLLKENAEKRNLRSLGSSSISIAKRLVGHDEFRSKLRKMLKSLSRVKECAEMLVRVIGPENCSSHMLPEGPLQWRITSSFSLGEFVVGRQKERDELVNRLLEQADIPKSRTEGAISVSPEVITIVGTGGIGKTTLAQIIYNDKRIEDNYDMRAWICVSHVFDKVRITKEILTSIDKTIDLTNFNFSMLQEELKNKVKMKKFLLVLDDVWYDEKVGGPINADRWRELFAPLWHGFKGVKILVTTRMDIVANTLDCTTPFPLSGLESEDSWELFRRCAFNSGDPKEHLEMKSIGERIVQRLNGSALAIKAVGGHLSSNFNDQEWNRYYLFLNKGLSNEKDIMTILRLSYECLPEHLRQCFSFCGLFPKGYYFEPDNLVNMWIAHEFIQVLQYGGKVHYVMHDLMNDLAVHISNASVGHIPHIKADGELCVEKTKLHGLEVLKYMNGLQGFLTITSLENVKNKNEASNAQLVNKSRISRLKLQWGSSNACSKSEEEYAVLNALRPHPGLEELIIDGYPGCTSPSWLESIWLSRLEHISIHDCACWKLLPPLGDLPSLRELHFDNMNALECISTSFYGVAGFPSLETLELKQLPELADWSSVDYAFPVLHDVAIGRCPKLKELPPIFPPPVKLKVLQSIICTWHTDHRLDTYITREVSLTSLLDLHLHYPESMESTDISFDGAGISNNELRDQRHNLPKGLRIPGCSDFPSAFLTITEMEIVSCPNITLLPDYGCFPVLQNLTVKDCPELKELPEGGNLTTLTEVLIVYCNKLVSLRSLRNLSFLSKLEIKHCLKLVALPEMVNFFSLRVMIIQDCPELVSLPEDGLPLTLIFLCLSGCHPLLEEQFEWKHGVEWEKYSVLPSCFYADKSVEDTQDIAEQILLENDMIEWPLQTSLLHPTDFAASSSSFLQ
ncbi:hypothetical protein OsI_23727 [Oryza sativa Indica Group]|uniref:Uncharacterized protein n=1 Tax=Oryza sativa subsp. indica TaxID=39946 RepID=A2YF41_ORYSI|nr:hypothetical protein OsI_23727 [Oryza sativa Indica Group]